MSARRYICWGEDQADLTDVVETLLQQTNIVVMETLRKERGLSQSPRILVTCPWNHENIFTLGGGVGEPPTDRDKIWAQAMNELTPPTKGLEVIGKHAQFIFGSVTLFSSLLTGLVGVVSDFKVPLSRLWLVAVPMSLLALSLALAAFAMTPGMAGLRARDLTSFERKITERLRRGGNLIRIAGIALSLAIFSTIPIYFLLVRPDEGVLVRPAFTLTPQENGSSTLTVSTEVSGTRRGMTAEVLITGVEKGVSRQLLKQQLSASLDGTFSTSSEIPKAEQFERFELKTKISKGAEPVHKDGAVFVP